MFVQVSPRLEAHRILIELLLENTTPYRSLAPVSSMQTAQRTVLPRFFNEQSERQAQQPEVNRLPRGSSSFFYMEAIDHERCLLRSMVRTNAALSSFTRLDPPVSLARREAYSSKYRPIFSMIERTNVIDEGRTQP